MTGNDNAPSDGVQELIDRLRADGVAAGQSEAREIIEHARAEAKELLRRAEEEAAQTREDARREAERTLEQSQEATRSALRDAMLRFGDELQRQLQNRTERFVREQLVDAGFLRELILAIVRRTAPTSSRDEELELLLPLEPMGLAQLKNDPAALQDELSTLAKQIAHDAGREEIRVATHSGSGIRIRIVDEGVEIDVSPESVSALLLDHLQPRFQAILQGILA
ncbi:MAG: hypothetical protein AAFU77_05495 [Myxococcota bacterium]